MSNSENSSLWKVRNRDFSREKTLLKPEPVLSDPLYNNSARRMMQSKMGNKSLASSENKQLPNGVARQEEIFDPLGVSVDVSIENMSQFSKMSHDPLSEAITRAVSQSTEQSEETDTPNETLGSGFVSWSEKKKEVLKTYTTTERISMDFTLGARANTNPQSTSERVGERLDQLEDLEESAMMSSTGANAMSQKEYMERIKNMTNNLTNAWNNEEKVKSLKIAIQCAKLMGDPSPLGFYPSKFVLVADILDSFGQLVYSRLRARSNLPAFTRSPASNKDGSLLPVDFTPDVISENAKETARNWFFKIASIRELLPRIYMEASIIRCYAFLSRTEHAAVLQRLVKATRGIGNPLVAAYLRLYLSRMAVQLNPSATASFQTNFTELFQMIQKLTPERIKFFIPEEDPLESAAFMQLFIPPAEYILSCIIYNRSKGELAKISKLCQKHPLFFHAVFSTFPATFITNNVIMFTDYIKSSEAILVRKSEMYRILGEKCVYGDVSPNDRPELLNAVWKMVRKIENPIEFLHVAAVWLHFAAVHCGPSELAVMLKDVTLHVQNSGLRDDLYSQLVDLLKRQLNEVRLKSLLSVPAFLTFLDLFQKSSARQEVSFLVLEKFLASEAGNSDLVTVNALLHICKGLHDSVDALTDFDISNSICNIIERFIDQVSFGRDFEQQLLFYVDCRGSFPNFERVLIRLVHAVNRISINTRVVVKGHHSQRTASFVRACVAYNFITIPSLASIPTRLQLYLISAQVALQNHCLAQADAYFEAMNVLIPHIPLQFTASAGDTKGRSTESFILAFMSQYFTTLIVAPDHPEKGIVANLKGALNSIESLEVAPGSHIKQLVFVRALKALSVYLFENYPFKIHGVENNSSLYAADKRFLSEICKMCRTLYSRLINDKSQGLAGSQVFSEVASVLITFGANDFDLISEASSRACDVLSTNLVHKETFIWFLRLIQFHKRNPNSCPALQPVINKYEKCGLLARIS